MSAHDDLACRYVGSPGHVESYFWRANHPDRPLALWLKATILAPLSGQPVAETWAVLFDGENQRVIAQRHTEPFANATFPSREGAVVRTSWLDARLGSTGRLQGAVDAPEGRLSFELTTSSDTSSLARPLLILPWRTLLSAPLPRSKLVTPSPVMRFRGQLDVAGQRLDVRDWVGMNGHNWGREHASEYAWGQCVFSRDETMVEAFTARVRVAGIETPRLSCAVVRRAGREYRFDTLFDTWRQQASFDGSNWSLELRSGAADLRLEMHLNRRPMACLGYQNPNGRLSYCLNTKLAEVSLTVRPDDAASFTCHSAHGGALEFLTPQADPRFSRVV